MTFYHNPIKDPIKTSKIPKIHQRFTRSVDISASPSLFVSCLSAVHVNGAIRKAGGQVLVVRREAHAEAIRHRSVSGVHGVLGPGELAQSWSPYDGYETPTNGWILMWETYGI